MMKNIPSVVVAWSLFLSALVSVPSPGSAGLPAPPPLLVPAPPLVVLIPGTYAYFAPDLDADLIFYGGRWYRPYGGRWYVTSHYNGPWGFVAPKKVPRVLINLPPGYRAVPPGHQRIPYGQLKKNWKTWEWEKHWDKPGKPKKLKKHADKKLNDQGSSERGSGKGRGQGHGR